MNASNKIKLVVVEKATLAYIHPLTPNIANVLKSSVLRGSKYPEFGTIEIADKDVRLASEADFERLNVCFDGYKKDSEMFEFALRPAALCQAATTTKDEYAQNTMLAEVR